MKNIPQTHVFLSGFILGAVFGMSGIVTFSAGILTGVLLLEYRKNS